MNIQTRRLLLIVGGMCVLGGIAAVVQQPPSDAYRTRPGRPSPARERELTVSAAELAREYTQNEVAADQRYKGEIVVVTGSVDAIAKDVRGIPYVTLRSLSNRGETQAMFTAADENALAVLRPGSEVTVRCRCAGKLFNVILRDCSLR